MASCLRVPMFGELKDNGLNAEVKVLEIKKLTLKLKG
jgi:hypothetical protein